MAAAAGGTGLLSGEASAATTRRGVKFDRVVNVVDHLGLDPNGNESIQRKINNADQEGTLFVFPEGEYLVTDRILLLFNDAVGMVGRGNVRFKVPKWYNDWAVIIDHGEDAVFENIDIDLRAKGATPGCRFGGYGDVDVRNAEFVGQGIHSGGSNVNPALALIARDSNATVTARNVVARNRGRMGAYNRGNGRTGVWVGRKSKGTVTLQNCQFSGFPNNGLYTSRTPGAVQVEGGVFRNNDIAQVRLGSKGSYVKNALIEVDPSKSNSPNPGDMLNGRGVRIESGSLDTAGVTVENCDIRIAKGVNSFGGVVAARPGGMFDVVDTRIKVDADNTHAVLGCVPDGGSYGAPPWPHRGRLKNVSVTGRASGGPAIEMRSRPKSVIRSCCIEQRSNNRSAVKLVNSSNSVVRESTLNVSGQAIKTQGTNANSWDNTTSGSCPLPGSGGTATSGTEESGGSNSGSNTGGSSGTRRLEIRGSKRKSVKYSVKVSGEINGTGSSEWDEANSSQWASGWVGNGLDAFTFTGRIEKLVVKGRLTLVYERSSGASDTLRFQDNWSGQDIAYTAQVGRNAWGTGTGEGNDGTWSTGSTHKVKGSLGSNGSWQDTYGCKGWFRSASLDDGFQVAVSND